ncbi:MAG TPA: amidoligase family protein [Kineosporiaceae bacterium]
MPSPVALPRPPLPFSDPTASPTSRIGWRIELLAPRGSTRADLAIELARRGGGTVEPIFHSDSEPSLVPGMDHFVHLTQGFRVLDPDDAPVCTLVDDVALRADLDRGAGPRPGWYRILSDEPRLIRVVHRLVDPTAPLETVLDPVAEVFGAPAQHVRGTVKVDDPAGATIAIAAPLSGECERPCAVITPMIDHDHRARLGHLLAPARDLGFTVPQEAAVQLRVDAEPLRQVHAFANLVRLFSAWRDRLRAGFATNPRCRRLGPLPQALVELAARPLPSRWEDVARAAARTGLTTSADINLTDLVSGGPGRNTVEIRCLPGSIDADRILAASVLIERLLRRCQELRPLPLPAPGDRLEDLLTW